MTRPPYVRRGPVDPDNPRYRIEGGSPPEGKDIRSKTRPLQSCDFVPWRFYDASRASAAQGSRWRRQRNLHRSGHYGDQIIARLITSLLATAFTKRPANRYCVFMRFRPT